MFNEDFFNLREMIKHSIKQVEHLAIKKKIKINEEYISDGENDVEKLLQNVYGDQRRYIQIIQNFLSNAVKFTNENGEIQIRLTLLEHQEVPTK